VNGLDAILLVMLAAACAWGFRRGAAMQFLELGGMVTGLIVGAVIAPRLAGLVESPRARAVVALVTLLALGVLGDALGSLAGVRVRKHARNARLGPADAVGGSLVALLAMLLAIWFIGLNLVNGPFPLVASEIRGSAIVRGLGSTLPDPPSFAGQVRRLFDRFGFPEVFEGIPPDPASPVRPASRRDAQQAFDAAAPSTVKVLGRACDSLSEGSGFVAADAVTAAYVVTNAHVVAGMRDPQVEIGGGAFVPATTVLFDPALDIAVLRLAEAPGPPLALETAPVDRGAVGAVLGYPQGGGLTGSGAAVRQSILAAGHDIYGRGDVERDVYEIQTVIHPGNSGGPFVLVDGRVAGIVFAASTVEDGVGYAIRSGEFVDDVERAISRSAEVSTGPCLP
jgi:S1-C subfamily serine protease